MPSETGLQPMVRRFFLIVFVVWTVVAVVISGTLLCRSHFMTIDSGEVEVWVPTEPQTWNYETTLLREC